MNARIEKLRHDPRLAKVAEMANCTADEFFKRLCKNSGIRLDDRKK